MAQMSAGSINDLPDSAFAYIEPGGSKDAQGKTVPRSKRHFPIHDAAHVRNALSRAPQSPFGDKAMPKIRAAAKKLGIDVSEPTASRAEDLIVPEYITRATTLDDLSVRSGKVTCETCGQDATGRMVDAYAAVFGQPAEINDAHGHYVEEIDQTAFNRRLDHLNRSKSGMRAVGVYYNHAKTLYDTPSEAFSIPVGHPSAIRADGHGLLTSTHYTRNGDVILAGIKDGDITGHSFTGRIVRSNPDRVPRVTRGGSLPRVVRTELGLTEYGATPMPYYDGAQLVGVRSQIFPVQHSERLADTAPPLPPGLGAEDSPTAALRSAAEIRRRARLELTLRSSSGQDPY